MSKLIADKFGRGKAKLTFTLILVAIVLVNTLVLLSRSTCVHGATVDHTYGTILNNSGFKTRG